MADKGDEYITSLIFHAMWGTAACWTTVSQINKGLKGLKFKKDKQQALKDNIQMWWKGFGIKNAKLHGQKVGGRRVLQSLQKY